MAASRADFTCSLSFTIAPLSDFALEPPTDCEYTTDKEGHKRVGYVPGGSAGESDGDVASKPLPMKEEAMSEEKEQKKEKEKDHDAESATEALKSLSLESSPLPEEDPDNGADFDVLVEQMLRLRS